MRKTNEKGITLVVLIITVVLLLILATIVIDFIIEGSIIDRVEGLVNKSENQQGIMNTIRVEVRNQINSTI